MGETHWKILTGFLLFLCLYSTYNWHQTSTSFRVINDLFVRSIEIGTQNKLALMECQFHRDSPNISMTNITFLNLTKNVTNVFPPTEPPFGDCCYPTECSQAKNNPPDCTCTYMVMCGVD